MIKKIIKQILGKKISLKIYLYFKKRRDFKIINNRKKFYLQFLKPGSTYFDVGANYGNRIEPIVNEKIKIIAVEPQTRCINFLKEKYQDKITIIPKGLGEKKGIQPMYISNNHTLSSFSKDWINATNESGRFSEYKSYWNDKGEDIEIDTLDNLISEFGKPQFIKIDVEGYEYEVLKGLSQPINAISFEYTIPERRDSVIDCIVKLVEINNNKVLFNYSIEESMEWALKKWISPEEMIKEVDSERFINSGFGDVYAKNI